MSSERAVLLRMLIPGQYLARLQPTAFFQVEAVREGDALLLRVGRGTPGKRAPAEPLTELRLGRGTLPALLDVLAVFTTEIRAMPAHETEAKLANLEPG